ncbi:MULTISPECIES: LPS-assembly protein LptD [Sphingomonas]|uniref:LPS-assembly protein LptD n=1 Tax=Sphingomonas TaxID=13687 RepID=UPI000836E8DA|nr:LPS assembly protein LptD [Sphingomonas sp. CCH10-B3]
MRQGILLTSAALAIAFGVADPVQAQDLQDRATPLPPPLTPAEQPAPTKAEDQIQFSANELAYDTEADVVTATGDVRMYREGDRLRADKVTWNRKTGRVIATGNIVVTNPGGDQAYGDSIELTDSLKDGVVENMLVVLDRGGRLAAQHGERDVNGVVTLTNAAYTPCAVTNAENCPKEPSWKITAVSVVYNPAKQRIYYKGARISIFGIATLPLPALSNPVGDNTQSGLLNPDIRYTRTNGFEYAQPFYISIAPNRGIKVTPRIFSQVLPLLSVDYNALTTNGAYRVALYGTVSDRTDTGIVNPTTSQNVFRGYAEGAGRFQLTPNWSVSGAFRVATDRTFLRRYDISRDDILRSTIRVERIDQDSYFAISGWAVQTLRVGDRQGLQPVALPEIDYRRRFRNLLGGELDLQVNTLAIGRTAGQDTQRAFTSATWKLRRITGWGQEVTLTGYLRGDLYNSADQIATTVASYRGNPGIQTRGIAAVALDVKWPFVGAILGGTQRLTPRVQIVASPKIANLIVPNEDSRAVDLEDSNLFALNRFPGYDRFGGTTRITYGVEWALDLPDLSITANVGQSYRFSSNPGFIPQGTGFADSLSDIVGRTEVRYRDLVSLTHRYRLDKDGLAIRRNELDATIGTRGTYLLLGYLRLNRQIDPTLEDLRDREEVRLGGRLQFARFWSMFGSTVIDLTTQRANPLSTTDGFAPVRHRIGVGYEDDCLRLGLTWRRDYQDTGDARRGDSFLLTLAFKNLGR